MPQRLQPDRNAKLTKVYPDTLASAGPTNGTSLRISTIRIATGHGATAVLACYLIAVPIAWQAIGPLVSTAKPKENHEGGYCNAAHFAETERAADDADDFSTCDLKPF